MKKSIVLEMQIVVLIFLMLASLNTLAQFDENFDWNSYRVWENGTAYKHTYYVDQKHSLASDQNPGSKEKPFKTINKAAQVVKAGQRVLIAEGVYREMIEPVSGGKSNTEMISYEAIPGHNVVVSGSRVLDVEWIQRRVITDVIPDSSLTYTWSRKLWLATVPDELFENGYFPLRLRNIEPADHALMPWAGLTKELSPYNSRRALLFQNGRRMIQLENYGDLQRVEGSFWVDDDGKTLHIHAFGSGNPNREMFELAVQSHLFRPKKIGLGYIQIRGLTFQHCANGFLRTGTGAVNAKGGHHWIIEDNDIRQINSSGLEFGYMAYERRDPSPENIERTGEYSGNMIVRNNRISECGTAGMRSYIVVEGIIENNTIWNCGWQDAENYWECSGIKLLMARNTLIKANHIYNIQGGNGIWVDWDNRYTRVTSNVIHDIQNIQGGIFMEASTYPTMIDNNFIWNIDGNGIYGNESDRMIIAHNLVANTTGPVVSARLTTGRTQNGRPLTVKENVVVNNIFINAGAPVDFEDGDNSSDNNLFITTREPDNIDLEKIRKENGYEKNSGKMKGMAEYDRSCGFFNWNVNEKVPVGVDLKKVKFDIFGNLRDSSNPVPGPFSDLNRIYKKVVD